MKISRFSNDTNKPFHTSAYAEAANGSSMGATSAQSFNQRYRIDQNRKMIQRYRDSYVASGGSRLRQELNQRIDNPGTHDEKHKYKFTRQGFNAGEVPAGPTPSKAPVRAPKRSFSEPPSRKYNPFS